MNDSRLTQLPTKPAVLVVDDEGSVRAVTERMLHVLGAEVVQVGDGSDALEVFRALEGKFELVLLDMHMPYMGGSDVYRELKRLKPDVRVILMSGYSEEDAASLFA